nr:ligand-dependent corepressor isoform X2 [Jaculus jaculus]
MVKLCTHHQKQFIRVLSDLYTESQPGTEDLQPLDSVVMDATTCSADCAQLSSRQNKEKSAVCSDRKSPTSTGLFLDSSSSHGSLQMTEQTLEEPPPETDSVAGKENALAIGLRDSSELPATQPNSGISTDSSTVVCLTASNSSSLNSHHSSKSFEGQTSGQEQDKNVKAYDDDKNHVQSSALPDTLSAVKVAKNPEESNTCTVSQRNSFRALSEETWDSGFTGNSPRTADKENALQCSSKTSSHQDIDANEQDARPKQENHLYSLGRNKVGYHSHPSDKGQFDHSKDGWLAPSPVPAVQKASNGHSRTKMTSNSIKTARKSKRASGLRINDYDNQCDVVYISQPITECHFENQRSILSSRKTARKSTRGYFFNGDCCELPTVRTLARNLHSQDKGSCSSPALEAVVTPRQTLTFSSPRLTLDVQLPEEDRPEEPRKDRTSIEEGGRDSSSPLKEHQEPEVCPSMSEPDPSSSPRPSETTGSSLMCPLPMALPDENVLDMPEDSTVVSIPTASALSSSEQDKPPATLLGAEEVHALQDCHLVPTAESISGEASKDLLARPPSSLEIVAREESSLFSENESPPVGLDPPLSPEQTEHEQSICTEADAENISVETLELATAQPMQDSSTLPGENPSEGEGLEAAFCGEQPEEGDTDIKCSLENDLCEPNSDSPEEIVDKKKKSKKFPEASDRCLRSQLSDSSSADRCLDSSTVCPEIKVSKNPGAKHSKREDHTNGTTPEGSPVGSIHTEALEDIDMPCISGRSSEEDAELEAEESGVTTRQTFKNMLAKEVKREEGEIFSSSDPTVPVGQPLPGEQLEIYVQSKVEEKDTHVPSESISYERDPEESKERQGHIPTQDVEAVVNEVDGGNTHWKDDASLAPSSTAGVSGSQSADATGPPKLVARPKRLPSSTYNLRHAHCVDVLQTTKAASEKEVSQVSLAPKGKAASEDTDPLDEEDEDMSIEERPRFVEWCAEEENQELIATFNAQYLKVQKGWIQLEKEAQPAARARSKSDKLKEIWKSKRRSRKCRGSLEGQKFSPVQMLFMTSFKLSNVCKWFLETTETRSLVIVKKLNTRLPGDVPPVKHPLQKYSPSSLYPSSLQAERLKKHLKKFPGAMPARNNWKTQKLWSKLRENPDRMESESSSDANLGPDCEDSTEEVKEGRNSHPPTSLPTPASTRILRKYSNIRGKLRAQQRLVKSETREGPQGSSVDSKDGKSRKSVCINPLMSPKHALQVGADGFPVNPKSAKRIKRRKGRQVPEISLKGEGQKKRRRTEGGSTQESKDKGPATKASKEKHVDAATRTLSAKKLAARDRINQLPKKINLKENKVKIRKKSSGKSCPSSRKEKESTSKRPSQPAACESLKPAKQKGAGEATSRPTKARSRARSKGRSRGRKLSTGKSRVRTLTKSPDNRTVQRKRKRKRKLDSVHNKRRRLDAK